MLWTVSVCGLVIQTRLNWPRFHFFFGWGRWEQTFCGRHLANMIEWLHLPVWCNQRRETRLLTGDCVANGPSVHRRQLAACGARRQRDADPALFHQRLLCHRHLLRRRIWRLPRHALRRSTQHMHDMCRTKCSQCMRQKVDMLLLLLGLLLLLLLLLFSNDPR